MGLARRRSVLAFRRDGRHSTIVRAFFARWWPTLPLTALFLFFGWRGLDFGVHWDEPWFFIPIQRFAADGNPLPRAYNYPSLSYFLSYLAGTPELLAGAFSEEVWHRPLQRVLHTFDFKMRMRTYFLVISGLTIPLVYGSILGAGRSVSAAAFGTLAVVGSFEFGYHARWIAPDGPLVAAVALATWALAAAAIVPDEKSSTRWRRLATVAAGLATGTKYPAGLLLLPAFTLAVWPPMPASWPARARAATETLGLFVVVYLLTTPGTVLETNLFITHVREQMKTYGGGFGPYTVGAGPEHLGRILLYAGGTVWSGFPLFAAITFSVTLFGAVHMAWRRPRLAMVVFMFPILFVAYFSVQRTMIVRNLLVVIPGMALALGWAIDVLLSTRRSAVRVGATAAIVAVLGVNIGFVASAAQTVRERRHRAVYSRRAAAYAEREVEAGRVVFISPKVRRRMANAPILSKTATVTSGADLLMFETDEGFPKRWLWPGNVWGLTETWFGPWEINFDCYPTWDGDPRIVVMRRTMAEQVKLPLIGSGQESP